ncbi:AarF/ABC1/UbiB kinase family protein [Bdellovibrio sp. HCB274]|uniref:AarF/ABC1/UbiB kinase family protein n=1 Tax=Bdellovibrio sp. HCB274 TaxID=3394361 RepID=UPI0039B41917
MKTFLNFTLYILMSAVALVATAAPGNGSLYLSYEQRIAVTYAMMASGESAELQEKYLDRGIQYFQNTAQLPVETVEVKNFQEFLREFRGQWPNTQSVEMDLEIIEKSAPRGLREFKSSSHRVQRQIDDYIEWQENQLKSQSQNASGGKFGMLNPAVMAQAAILMQTPAGVKQARKLFLQNSDQFFQGHLKEFDRIGEKVATSGMANTQDKVVKIVMETMLSEYFARLSLGSKKLIVSSFLGGDLKMSDMQKFEVMVQNSGPQLQKLLQVIARQGDLDPEMIKIFKRLEDAVRSVPYHQVEKLLNAEKKNYEFIYFEQKPLGVGTMAQVHRAKILMDSIRRDVVVRFIKPDIEKRVFEDERILSEVAKILDGNAELAKSGMPKMAPLVADITATVTAELSQEDTVARQKYAATRYNQEVFMKTPGYKNVVQFHVPEIYSPKEGQTQFMVQEMVFGKKLDKESKEWSQVAPQLKIGIVEELVRLWGTEAMFGSGFYHSDLHQGNFLVRFGDEKIRVNLLDFGMGGRISREMQQSILLLESSLVLKDADLIGRSLWNISDKVGNRISESQFMTLVAAKVRRGFKTANDNSAEEWTKWALNHGLRLPYDFININRGMTILKKMLAESGSTKDMTSIMSKEAVKRPFQVIDTLVGKKMLSPWELVKAGGKSLFEGHLPPAVATPSAPSCSSVFVQ